MKVSGKTAAFLFGQAIGMSMEEIEESIGEEGMKEVEKEIADKCFHKGGAMHDTYAEQEKYVHSLGNKWAEENFNATKPYFC